LALGSKKPVSPLAYVTTWIAAGSAGFTAALSAARKFAIATAKNTAADIAQTAFAVPRETMERLLLENPASIVRKGYNARGGYAY
jgi:hypothetical protein